MQIDRIPRNGSVLLIDDLGHERLWPSAELAAEHDCPEAEFDFPDHAVRRLGYILVVERLGFLRICMRPLLVSNRAVAALCYLLAERRPRRAAISWFDDEWRHEVCGTSRMLFRRIAEILDGSLHRPRAEPFFATRRSLQAILSPRGHRFEPLLRLWLEGARSEDLKTVLQASGLWDRAMIAHRDAGSGEFFFRHSGSAIQLYGAAWADVAVGRRIADQPDPAYGAWIAESCRAVDDNGEARCELVHANVRGPHGRRRQFRYERLVLSWQAPAGGRTVVSVSAADPGPGR